MNRFDPTNNIIIMRIIIKTFQKLGVTHLISRSVTGIATRSCLYIYACKYMDVRSQFMTEKDIWGGGGMGRVKKLYRCSGRDSCARAGDVINFDLRRSECASVVLLFFFATTRTLSCTYTR